MSTTSSSAGYIFGSRQPSKKAMEVPDVVESAIPGSRGQLSNISVLLIEMASLIYESFPASKADGNATFPVSVLALSLPNNAL